MHEVSLIESVIALVEEQRRAQDFARVRSIRLQVGALGHAEPASLRFCFDAVAQGTIAEGARLMIDVVMGEGRCGVCDKHVPLDDRFACCPLCGSHQVRMTAGDELRLAELEVE
jgi:hydrogenase nickel incorporation protein HypA/HybF